MGTNAYFRELLKGLVMELRQQVQDRRSQVARQVCHSLGVMADVMGNGFDWLGVQLVPDILRVLIITIQVMADSANLCLKVIIQHCHSGKMLSLVLEVLCNGKNGK